MMSSKTEQTIQAYNKNAVSYLNKFSDFQSYIRKISDFREKYITPNSSILDLGCGPGNNIRTILDQDSSCQFTGVDLSEQFIQIATKNFPQFTFLKEDIRTLTINSQYDAILASFCIVHLTDAETAAFIKKIPTMLKANGYLYLSFMEGKKAGFETTSFSKDKIFFNYYSRHNIVELLRMNQFKIIELTQEDYLEQDGSVTNDIFMVAQLPEE